MFSIERDWYDPAARLMAATDRKEQTRLRKELRHTILPSADLFPVQPFFLPPEFPLVDATLPPIVSPPPSCCL